MQVRDRVVELRRVRAGDLLPNPKNWRRHPPQQQNAMRAMLADIGYADALLARETPDGLLLIDGHLRAETTPDETVPVLILDVDEVEADKLLATLDPLAGMAVADEEALSELMASVSIPSDDLLRELERLSGQDGPPQGLTDPDAVPAVPEEPVTKPGDLWVLGEHRLLCADATEALSYERLDAPAALIFTDPPYGISYRDTGAGAWDERKKALKRAGLLKPRFEAISGDELRGDELFAFLVAAFTGMAAASTPTAAWYVWHAAQTQSIYEQALGEAGYLVRNQVVWAKSRPGFNFAQYKSQHESCFYAFRSGQAPAWYGDRTQTTLWEVPSEAGSVYRHPTQKPVELANRAIVNSSLSGELVLDPFMGSGSTLIACEEFGRKGRGMEIDPRYCDVVVRRWEEFAGGKAVLAE